mmetsp:Transcript_33271/g.77797  ORF Transcript_33271/g.77797 Transcript_33271/m.77797 type:complete len:722 (+) Transcript_33271:98-2263(+)
MIQYNRGGVHKLWNFVQKDGSVFPISFLIAFPCGAIAALLKFLIDSDMLSVWAAPEGILKESTAWGSVQFLVGFLIVFRTSQSYARFSDGCSYMHQMRAHWYAGCAAAVSFSRGSESEAEKKVTFQHVLIRLVSMLHAVALAEVEDCSSKNDPTTVAAFRYPLLDASALDSQTLEQIRDCDSRVELAYQWIQNLLAENQAQSQGVLHDVPAPVLAVCVRSFFDGMVAFNEAIKVSTIPFPFPYAQTCDWILVLHWVLTPIIVAAWVGNMVWAFIFAFLQVFILWSLNIIAIEIENPFGLDANDIDAEQMQDQLNHNLCLLIHPSAMRTPGLNAPASDMAPLGGMGLSPSAKAQNGTDNMWRTTTNNMRRRQSLHDVWEDMSAAQQAMLAAHSGPETSTSPSARVPALSVLTETNGRSSSSGISSLGTGSGKSLQSSSNRDLGQEPLESPVSGVHFHLDSSGGAMAMHRHRSQSRMYASDHDNIPSVLNANAISLPVKRYTSRDKKRAKAARRREAGARHSGASKDKDKDPATPQHNASTRSVRDAIVSVVSGMGLVPSARWSSKRSDDSGDGDWGPLGPGALPVRGESNPSVGGAANLAAVVKSGETMKIMVSDGKKSNSDHGASGVSSTGTASRRAGHEDSLRNSRGGSPGPQSESPAELTFGAELPRVFSSPPVPQLMAQECTAPPTPPGDLESLRIEPDGTNGVARGRPHANVRRLAI